MTSIGSGEFSTTLRTCAKLNSSDAVACTTPRLCKNSAATGLNRLNDTSAKIGASVNDLTKFSAPRLPTITPSKFIVREKISDSSARSLSFDVRGVAKMIFLPAA